MHPSVGLLSLSVQYPRHLVTNDEIRARSPALVADAERRSMARLWSGPADDAGPADAWGAAMRPYVQDPFRGAVERRHLRDGESSLALELAAAREAMARRGVEPDAIDLVIAVSFLPDQISPGNSAFVCRALGLRSAAAFNLETACSGSLVAFQTACALVQAGKHRTILVVVSCDNSRRSDPDDTLGWFLGDGAAAFIVGEVPAGEGLLAQAARHTGSLCDAFRYELAVDPAGAPRLWMRAAASAGATLMRHQDDYLLGVAHDCLARAGLRPADIDLFVHNTPTAWFHRYFAGLLDVDPARTVTAYPRVGNIGPVLIPSNLHFAATRGRLAPGDLVLLVSIGTVASTAAAVVRWGDVTLGADPIADDPAVAHAS